MPYSATAPHGPVTGSPQGLALNNFSPVGGGIASQTELYTLYDRPRPEMTWLFSRHIGFPPFSVMLSGMGNGYKHDKNQIAHYEDPWLCDTIIVNSVVTGADPGAGGDVIIELAAANMYNTSMTVSGGTATQASYPIVSDVVELSNRMQARVVTKNTAVTPHRLTLRPLVSTDNIFGNIQVNDEIPIVYNLHAEGSGLPAGRAPRIMKFVNSFGIIKHRIGVTGTELTNSVYHELIAGDAGSAGQSIYVKIKTDEIKRYEYAKSNYLLFGQVPDNLTESVAALGNLDVAIGGGEGYVPFALTAGSQTSYTAGAYSSDDLDEITDVYYDQRSAPSADLICFDGPDISKETENAFDNAWVQNWAPFVDRIIDGYSSFMTQQYHEMIDGKPTDATLVIGGYSCIQKNGFVFHFKRLSEFHDIKGVGLSGYIYRGLRLVSPVGYMQDARTSELRPMVGYAYKGLDGYQRENVFGHLPGAGVGGDNSPWGRAVNQNDLLDYYLISEISGHWALGNAVVTQSAA